MKRNGLLHTLALILLVMAQIGCQQPAPSTNKAASEANSQPKPATIDKAAIEKELMRIETDFPRAMKEKDVAAVTRVEAEDLVYVDPDGTLRGREQDLKDVAAGALAAETWDISELNVNVLSNEAAVVTGRVVVKNGKYTAPDGKTYNISGEYRLVDTFARRNGQWQLVAGASVPIQKSAAPAASQSK
jgi:ketosteroid isomerase-like protein